MTKLKLEQIRAAGLEQIRAAGSVLCEFCENDECENCIVARLLEDAEIEYENNAEDEDTSYCYCIPDPFESVRPDVIEYLKEQSEEYFTARKATLNEALRNTDLLDDLCGQYKYAMNTLGYDRDAALKNACDQHLNIWNMYFEEE